MSERPHKRDYVPSAKHKAPKGFGTLCPAELTLEEAQQMLDRAIAVPDVTRKALWMAAGQWCFQAFPSHPHDPDQDDWHGFPVVGGEVDDRVLRALRTNGAITDAQLRRLRRQRNLPTEWPR